MWISERSENTGFEMCCAKVLQYSPRTKGPGITRSALGREHWRERLIDNQLKLWDELRSLGDQRRYHLSPNATYIHDDAVHWLSELSSNSIQAMVTDPPYGLIEYEEANLAKRRSGRGGVWRIPPAFDGAERSPLPLSPCCPPTKSADCTRFSVPSRSVRFAFSSPAVTFSSLPTLCSRP